MNFKAQLAILLVLVGCCSNVVFLELIVKEDPGAGNLVTFSQFLVIAIEGFVFTSKFLTVEPKVPFSSWIFMVVMFFLVSVSNNYALNFNIPMPLHMIFRAGSLMANMLMGIALLGKATLTNINFRFPNFVNSGKKFSFWLNNFTADISDPPSATRSPSTSLS